MVKKIVVLSVGVLLAASLLGFIPVSAASPNLSRSYSSNTSIPSGSLVSLVAAKSNTVVPANTGNARLLAGVVVNSNQSLLAVNPTVGKLQIATNGTVNVLVSSVNGDIHVGQQVAVSPFNGIGMKSSLGDRVIGVADSSFNSNTSGVSTEQVKETNGKSRQLTIGYVKVTISIGTMNSANSVQSLQEFIEALTGHTVSVLRMVVSLAIAFVAILAIVTLIYASIYGSIVSIGRNPLAKLAVFRTLTSVIAMVTVLAIVAVVTIYLLLY